MQQNLLNFMNFIPKRRGTDEINMDVKKIGQDFIEYYSDATGKVGKPTEVTPSGPSPKGVGAEPRQTSKWGALKESMEVSPGTGAGLQRMFGGLAQAITSNVPTSGAYQLGGRMEQVAAAQQMEALRRGETLKGMAGYGIMPQERAAIASEALAERKMGLEKRRVDIGERQAEIYGEQVGKQEPWEERGYRELRNILAGKTAPVKKYTFREFERDGKKVFAALDPDTGEWTRDIATSPIIRSLAGDASLRSNQRQWVNMASRAAAGELQREGYGELIQDASTGEWTIKFNEKGRRNRTTANNLFDEVFNRQLDKYMSVGEIPGRYEALKRSAEPEGKSTNVFKNLIEGLRSMFRTDGQSKETRSY